MNVYILTEGNSQIGFGHITRCLSVYQAFNEAEANVQLVVQGDQSVRSVLNNINFVLCDWRDDYDQLLTTINNAEILVIDSTIAPVDYLLTLVNKCKLVAFIDDSRRINCDASNVVMIDWTPFIEKEYSTSDNLKSLFLLGCHYISLRKTFWDLSNKKINDTVDEIVITLGGNDMRNLSPVILNLLATDKYSTIRKTLIVGKGFKEIDKLKVFENVNNTSFIYYPDEVKMAEAFMSADIVISAGGQTLYELARIGVPTVAILIIDNQTSDIKGWKETEFIEYAGEWDDDATFFNLLNLVDKLIADKPLRKSKKKIGQAYVDGLGARRIAQILINKTK